MIDIATPQTETEQQEAIKQTMQAYLQRHPETTQVCFFLPSDQGIDDMKRATATLSQELEKPIDLIYPISSSPAIMKRNEVLQEIRGQFGSEAPHILRLIDGLLAAWDAQDQFISLFGA